MHYTIIYLIILYVKSLLLLTFILKGTTSLQYMENHHQLAYAELARYIRF